MSVLFVIGITTTSRQLWITIINLIILINIAACKHEGKCIPFGGTVKEVCDTFVCSYDDKSMGYELMLQSQGLYYTEHVRIQLYKIESRIDNSCLIRVMAQNKCCTVFLYILFIAFETKHYTYNQTKLYFCPNENTSTPE